jgi:DNA ligase-associated metallophosphoesterase
MHAPVKYTLREQTLWLSSQRVIYWEEAKTLLLSDLHFGKTGHFRKAGIAVPQNMYKEDLQRLFQLIQFFKPEQLIIVGDMFHSSANKEMDFFHRWRNDFDNLHIQLVKGNHDILKDELYRQMDISVCDADITTCTAEGDGAFLFTHDIAAVDFDSVDKYVFSGHIHPGVRINGLGKQSLAFPCFYFGGQFAVLPAFSKFTGFARIDIYKEDDVFALVNDSVIRVN